MKAGNQICTQLTMKLFSKNVPPKVPIHFYHTSDKVQVLPGMQEDTGSKCLAHVQKMHK